MAGVWKVPAVFVVNNNGWAISVPLAKQTAAATFAQKAIAAGIPGEQVDGNDVIAVHAVIEQALARARDGLDASWTATYRLSDHTTADDASRYRDDAEVSRHWPADPVARLRNFLTRAEIWGKDKEEALLQECGRAVEQAADEYSQRPRRPSRPFSTTSTPILRSTWLSNAKRRRLNSRAPHERAQSGAGRQLGAQSGDGRGSA